MTNEQISEYKEAFSFFDKNNNGYFMISDLQEIMASLGMQITGNELLDIIDEIKTEKIDFKTFTSILVARVFHKKEEIYAVFNMIDKVNRFFHLFSSIILPVHLRVSRIHYFANFLLFYVLNFKEASLLTSEFDYACLTNSNTFFCVNS